MMRHRSGYTMVELLVCLGVIALLIGLLIPAVQNARMAADRLECKNHLKQIGLAAHGFHEAHEHFPHYGAFAQGLLPFLEQQNLFDEFAALEDKGVIRMPDGLGEVPILACPSNNVALNRYEVSYIVNDGHQRAYRLRKDWGKSNGMAVTDYNRYQPCQISDVRDGTSNTALMSESRPSKSRKEEGLYFRNAPRKPTSANDFRDLCVAAKDGAPARYFLHKIHRPGYYQHINLPNEPPCFWDGAALDYTSSKPPSSWHTGGVNLLLVDGSVRFIANEIDEIAWRELGSRNSDLAPTECWDR